MSQPTLHLQLEGFEGPLDLLLDLARAQKVDIARISILALVDQYLAVVEQARAVRLELAADWLVMAAWLAWLKSRLLVPEEQVEGEDPEALAAALTDRLAELERMRAAAKWLGLREQLGQEVFARGAPESLTQQDRSGISADLPALLQAYAAARRRALARRPYTPKARKLWTVQDALARLSRLVGALPGWAVLAQFLPEGLLDPVERRAALASTLVAALETARGGTIELRQERDFSPILLRRRAEDEAERHERAA
ncbi:segregation/condensation protein A [Siccirubricoccus sp. KC 17139]|uniref:Segregation and condensation protein A n=1 Tax=Siccirubricoccus soli TaxID=2899147 RepID=A0ABT1D4C9_9PROT|nr:ScpA family protein [Siccirubricoccus soli]MCO6416783.1 segregation/condensation protein A [Siccirubricoccus soli]MCP2682918.1 segregation/condensation protein A [Siccirubricoccus soli]